MMPRLRSQATFGLADVGYQSTVARGYAIVKRRVVVDSVENLRKRPSDAFNVADGRKKLEVKVRSNKEI